jgi:hypothetical protein
MKNMALLPLVRSAAFGVLAAFTLGQPALRAADHGDSPVPSNNQEADIADVYFFMDPNAGSTDNVILIATIRGFIAAGENSNFGIFDPGVRYHFEIETDGAPDTKADKFIDVTFTPRTADAATQAGKEILQIPKAQTATVAFSPAFKDATGKKLGKFTGLPTTGSNTTQVPPGTAPAQVIDDVGTTGIKFFAGMVDDPFFFDIPATGAFIKAVREGTANPADAFLRGRDSFAGYNVMGIALSIPKTLLLETGKTTLGAAFYAQKHIVQNPNKKDGSLIGTGAFKTIDRMGNPAVNVVLIPFNRKNEYNQGTPKDDAKLRFAVDILRTLKALGNTGTGIDADGNLTGDITGTALILAQVAVLNGDYLRLDTSVANDGTLGTGFPNGRRPTDDVVDIELSLIANQAPPFTGGFVLSDHVDASDPLPKTVFPFLALPNQPQQRSAPYPATDLTLDDKTRN